MPKHPPTFKHLVNSSYNQPRDAQTKTELSVAEQLAQLRISRPAVQESSQVEQKVWEPSTSIDGGLVDIDNGGVHAAEIARRSFVARRQAARRVAGPAPPPSWSAPTVIAVHHTEPVPDGPRRQVTKRDLERAASIFHANKGYRPIAPGTLAHACLIALLRELKSQHVIEEGYIGDLLAQQISYLDVHLKGNLLEVNSLFPEASPLRLSSAHLGTILKGSESLYDPLANVIQEDPQSIDESIEEGLSTDPRDSIEEDVPSWDALITSSTIHYLPLTLHPSPALMLRHLPTFHILSLTALNLAYSTISDLERLVSLLPVGLRELSLCGVRTGKKETRLRDGESWRRGLSALGRRLIVLTVSLSSL